MKKIAMVVLTAALIACTGSRSLNGDGPPKRVKKPEAPKKAGPDPEKEGVYNLPVTKEGPVGKWKRMKGGELGYALSLKNMLGDEVIVDIGIIQIVRNGEIGVPELAATDLPKVLAKYPDKVFLLLGNLDGLGAKFIMLNALDGGKVLGAEDPILTDNLMNVKGKYIDKTPFVPQGVKIKGKRATYFKVVRKKGASSGIAYSLIDITGLHNKVLTDPGCPHLLSFWGVWTDNSYLDIDSISLKPRDVKVNGKWRSRSYWYVIQRESDPVKVKTQKRPDGTHQFLLINNEQLKREREKLRRLKPDLEY